MEWRTGEALRKRLRDLETTQTGRKEDREQVRKRKERSVDGSAMPREAGDSWVRERLGGELCVTLFFGSPEPKDWRRSSSLGQTEILSFSDHRVLRAKECEASCALPFLSLRNHSSGFLPNWGRRSEKDGILSHRCHREWGSESLRADNGNDSANQKKVGDV